MELSCGVLVTDGAVLLLGHATRSPRWDIPKGRTDPGEAPLDTALRELREETGLLAPPAALHDLGRHRYLPAKALHLFAWRPDPLPDPARLRCTSQVTLADGTSFPELDRFGLFPWPDALARVGRNMRRVLEAVRAGSLD